MPLPGPTNLSPHYSPNLSNEPENVPTASHPKSSRKGWCNQWITADALRETSSWVSTMFEGERHTNIYRTRKTNPTPCSNSVLATQGKYLHRLNLDHLSYQSVFQSRLVVRTSLPHSPHWTVTLGVLTCVFLKLPSQCLIVLGRT